MGVREDDSSVCKAQCVYKHSYVDIFVLVLSCSVVLVFFEEQEVTE